MFVIVLACARPCHPSSCRCRNRAPATSEMAAAPHGRWAVSFVSGLGTISPGVPSKGSNSAWRTDRTLDLFLATAIASILRGPYVFGCGRILSVQRRDSRCALQSRSRISNTFAAVLDSRWSASWLRWLQHRLHIGAHWKWPSRLAICVVFDGALAAQGRSIDHRQEILRSTPESAGRRGDCSEARVPHRPTNHRRGG